MYVWFRRSDRRTFSIIMGTATSEQLQQLTDNLFVKYCPMMHKALVLVTGLQLQTVQEITINIVGVGHGAPSLINWM